MMTAILRRASSTLSKRAIPAAEALLSSTASAKLRQLTVFPARSFHSKSQPLLFRASSASRAGYAAEAFPFEEQSKAIDDDGLEIAKLGISQDIVSALEKKGITKLFPIQRAVLEPAMQGRDMIGRARTGTGKTLAFGIPIIDKIIQFNVKHGRGRDPLALVLAPTRELNNIDSNNPNTHCQQQQKQYSHCIVFSSATNTTQLPFSATTEPDYSPTYSIWQ
ncbi:unnamed protein product [Lathyrus sativus]|nr:unnamed protein product [Lathyrus sativus]